MMLAIDRNISVDIASVWERNTIISLNIDAKKIFNADLL